MRFLKWAGVVLAVLLVGGGVYLRVTYLRYFPKVPDEVGGPPASPPVLGRFGDDPPVTSVADWEQRRAPLLRAAFARDEYGPMPPPLAVSVLERETLPSGFAGDGVSLEQLTIGFGPGGERGKVRVVLARPPAEVAPRALVVMQNFCGNYLALHRKVATVRSLAAPPEMCDGAMKPIAQIILGKLIDGPPLKTVLARGYAVAMVYAADLVPDDEAAAPAALKRLYGDAPEGGALAAWAWLYSRLGDVLTAEPGLRDTPVVAWGHSRNGKAALLAAATDRSIAGVIAHQSGRGGAALNRSDVGESIAQITDAYGYWFRPAYAEFTGRAQEMLVDQHQLIALAAPRPVLLTTGDRDRWSDPASSFRAAQGASPVYELYGLRPFDETSLTDLDVTRPLISYMRRGTHGVTTADWNLFLDWLDAHFPAR